MSEKIIYEDDITKIVCASGYHFNSYEGYHEDFECTCIHKKDRVVIYDYVTRVEARKGSSSLYPNKMFFHDFEKSSKVVMFGLTDGCLLLESAVGKDLWGLYEN